MDGKKKVEAKASLRSSSLASREGGLESGQTVPNKRHQSSGMFLLSQTEIGHPSTLQLGQLESSPCEVRNKRVEIEQKTSPLPKEADPNSWSRLTHQSHLQKSTSFNQGQFVGSYEDADVLGSYYANSGCISSVLMPSKIHLERTQGRRADRFFVCMEKDSWSLFGSAREKWDLVVISALICDRGRAEALTNRSSPGFGVKSTGFKSPTPSPTA